MKKAMFHYLILSTQWPWFCLDDSWFNFLVPRARIFVFCDIYLVNNFRNFEFLIDLTQHF